MATFHSLPGSPTRAMRPFTIAPMALSGDRFPAFAPVPIMIALRRLGTPARMPVGIAIGATIATLATAPGPIADNPNASAKNTIGRSPALPRTTRAACPASKSSVPLDFAAANNSVTPASVRNNWDGNPAISVSPLRSAAYTPMTQASAMASSPTLTRVVMLSAIATRNASSASSAALNLSS